MRTTARVVVIGGGIHGASLLWHLAQEGWSDCVLVEKAELTSGSTWHAAGQITRSVGDYTTAAFHHYALELYAGLEAQTGQAVSLHTPGGLRVAYTPDEVDALKAQIGIGAYIGYPIELVGPSDLAELNPFYDTTDVRAAIWTEGEGHVDPSGATMAFIAGARAAGAEVVRRNRVLEVNPTSDGWSVVTEKGTIDCEHVVDAAGCYADQVAQLSGFRVPQANVLHHYLVTDPVPEFIERGIEMPVMRDNRVAGYIRQEQEAGLIGIYEHRGAEAAWLDGVPWDAENPLFDEDYDLIGDFLEESFRRVPVLADLGIRRVVRGAITHTTDSHMLLGPAPGVRNYWLNTGSSIGLAWGPGAGRELARWIVHGETELNIRHYDPRRYGWITPEHTLAKALEDYEWMFRCHLPGEERFAHRPVRTSPLYDRLAEKRAIFTQAFGWEQPKWFVPEDLPFEDDPGYRRTSWFDPVRAETQAVRERVGLMDLSAFSKFEVRGPDSATFLDRMVTNRLPKTDGRMALAYVLTATGRIETEVTITRLAADHFYVISGPMGETRDLDWFDQHIEANEDVTITDRSTELGVLVVAGPQSRELLARCTETDMSGEAFKWLSGQEIEVCGVPVRALRVGFTGALGWELHVEFEHMLTLYDGLWAAGADLGVADFGSYALNSLRMEKAYLTRHELTHDIGPRQAGVDRFLRTDKEYLGSPVVDSPPRGNDWRLAYMQLAPSADAPDADCHGGEGVFRDGRAVGLVTSGGYGYTVGKSLAFAYVDPKSAEPGTELDVLVLGERRTATVLAEPAYDPANADLRA
ncbi:MAG: FAD-dependent oxidoreductase [Acidimicrobiales bacterium]|nr:FAD-dependent oxidoreductase [Acidimicrobiales bacterium]